MSLRDGLNIFGHKPARGVREAADLVQDVKLLHAPKQGHLVVQDHVVRRAPAYDLGLANYQGVPLRHQLHLVGDRQHVCQVRWDLCIDLVVELLLVRRVNPSMNGPSLIIVLIGAEPITLQVEARPASVQEVLELPLESREQVVFEEGLPSGHPVIRSHERLQLSQHRLGMDDVILNIHQVDDLVYQRCLLHVNLSLLPVTCITPKRLIVLLRINIQVQGGIVRRRVVHVVCDVCGGSGWPE
mmetsp:Transcript_65099/g.146313  ORF Transcript_65099/g.146313 Transcript_65099/m.146313 type:complete len:242 (+) Transcript_65099:436-1161(+)